MHSTFMSDDLYSKNLQAIKKNHPYLLSQLDERLKPKFKIHITGSEFPNIYVERKNVLSPHLYPEDDPLKGVHELIETYKDVKGKVIASYGFGLGYNARAFIKSFGKSNIIVFFEAYPEIFKAALSVVDLTDVFNNKSAKFIIGKQVDFDSVFLTYREQLLTSTEHLSFFMHSAIKLDNSWYENIKFLFDRYIEGRILTKNTIVKGWQRFIDNRFNNIFPMLDSLPGKLLENSFKNIPAIVVAAGPSLSKNIKALKEVNNRALIVAVDTAVSPLSIERIKPHFFTTIDYNDFNYEKLCLDKNILSDSNLLYIPEVTSKIPNFISCNQKFYFFLAKYYSSLFNELLDVDADHLDFAQSVVHLAIKLVQTMGCNPVIFAGLDLAYDNNFDHAKGTVLHWGNNQKPGKNQVMVEGIDGEMLLSNRGFRQMISTCENLIKKYPEVKYIDATEGGAKISGTQISTLKQAIDTYCKDGVDIREKLFTNEKQGKVKNFEKRLQKQIDEAYRYKKILNIYFKSVSKIDKYVHKNSKTFKGPEFFPKNIAKELKIANQITDKFNEDQFIHYLTDILAQFHNNFYEYEVKKIVAEATKNKKDIFIAAHKQQKYAQSVKNSALDYIIDKFQKQLKKSKRLSQIEKKFKDDCKSDEFFMETGKFYYDIEYLEKAEAAFNELGDSNTQKYLYLGFIEIKKGRIKEGLNHLNKSVKSDNKNLMQKEQFLKDIEKEMVKECEKPVLATYKNILYDRIITINPDNCDITVKRKNTLIAEADLLIENSDFEAAKEFLKKVVKEREFGKVEFLCRLFVVCIKMGDQAESEAFLEKALGVKKEKTIKIVCTLWEKEKTVIDEKFLQNDVNYIEESLDMWKPVKNIIKDWHYFKARIFAGKNDFKAATLMMVEGVTIWPENTKYLTFLSRLLIENGNFDDGVIFLKEAVKKDPCSAVLWEEIGDALFLEKNYKTSVTAYENCIMALPEKYNIFNKIGDCYLYMGSLDAAKASYKTVLEKDPEHMGAKKRLDILQKK